MPAADYVIYQEPPRRPLTARNLGDFALCPQKFLLSFFVSRQASERFLGGAAAVHEALRAALVEGYREGGLPLGRGLAVSAERLLELFERHWEGRLCADSLEEEQLHRQGREMLRRYQAAHAGETARTVALDLRMEADLGAHRFVAVVDRATEGGGGSWIVDRGSRGEPHPPAPLPLQGRGEAEDGGALTLLRYKTTRQVAGPGQLGKDLSMALLLLVGEAHFGRAAQAAIYGLRAERLVVAEISAVQREAWREQLDRQATAIRRARDYPTVVGHHCSVCRCRSLCPAWHPPVAREEEAE
jgi:hypothetical protein